MKALFSEGRVSRAVLVKVLPGSDIIEGIEKACHDMDIKCGAITSCIGSLQRTSLLVAVPLNNKVGAGYSEPRNLNGPLELISGQGTIGEDEGTAFVHIHGMVSDKDGNVYGGHLIKGENPVLITCEIMISPVDGIQMVRTYDPEVDMKVFTIS